MRSRSDGWLLVGLASIVPGIQILALALSPSDYSYFIDEFYYIACSKHLALGYVDHPPLAPWLLAFTRLFLGDSLFGIRLLPFIAGGATVWLTARLVPELGGSRFAAVLAAVAFGLSPVFIAMTGFYSMNAFEPLLWTALTLTLVRLVKTGDSRLWLLAGVLVGLAFENKHTVVPYVMALAVGIVIARLLAVGRSTRPVRHATGRTFGQDNRAGDDVDSGVEPGYQWTLRDRSLWAGIAIAGLIALPNVIWQAVNGWPSLEFYRNAQLVKNIPVPPLQSVAQQVLAMNPVTFPVWLAGLALLLVARDVKPLRFAAFMFIALLAIHVASQTSRPDRMVAAYPILMAAGAVAIERRIRSRAARGAIAAAVAASGAALGLMFVPLLPPQAEARYVAFLNADIKAERGKTSPLPQLLADRTGWRSFIDDVNRVYRSLPPADRTRAIIYVPDYGHAGAIDLWGPATGLPRVIASQNTYWHWSDGYATTDVLIAVGARPGDLHKVFRDVQEAGTVRCDYCMSWRSHMPIYVAKDPIVPLNATWWRTRFYE